MLIQLYFPIKALKSVFKKNHYREIEIFDKIFTFIPIYCYEFRKLLRGEKPSSMEESSQESDL